MHESDTTVSKVDGRLGCSFTSVTLQRMFKTCMIPVYRFRWSVANFWQVNSVISIVLCNTL